jgi:hypothetical protein
MKSRKKTAKDNTIFYSKLPVEELERLAEPFESEFVPDQALYIGDAGSGMAGTA